MSKLTSETDPTVEYEIRDGVAWIHLNRPHVLNAVNPTMVSELGNALLRAVSDDVGAAVIAGRGRAFCAGHDLTQERLVRPELENRRQIEETHDITRLIRRAPFGVIASVHGYALGNGCEFAFACDYIVAANDAEFGFPEVGWGLGVTGGFTALLVASVGLHRAKDLILRGERFSALRAHEIGLVGQLSSSSELERTTVNLAATFAQRPRAAFVRAKRAIHLTSAVTLEAAYAVETEHSLLGGQGREAANAIATFHRLKGE